MRARTLLLPIVALLGGCFPGPKMAEPPPKLEPIVLRAIAESLDLPDLDLATGQPKPEPQPTITVSCAPFQDSVLAKLEADGTFTVSPQAGMKVRVVAPSGMVLRRQPGGDVFEFVKAEARPRRWLIGSSDEVYWTATSDPVWHGGVLEFLNEVGLPMRIRPRASDRLVWRETAEGLEEKR